MPVYAVSFRADEQQKKSYVEPTIAGAALGAVGIATGAVIKREQTPEEVLGMKPDEFKLSSSEASETDNKAVEAVKKTLGEIQSAQTDEAKKADEKELDDILKGIFGDKKEIPVGDYIKGRTGEYSTIDALEAGINEKIKLGDEKTKAHNSSITEGKTKLEEAKKALEQAAAAQKTAAQAAVTKAEGALQKQEQALIAHEEDLSNNKIKLQKVLEFLKGAKDGVVTKEQAKEFETGLQEELFNKTNLDKLTNQLKALEGKLPKLFSTKMAIIGAVVGAVVGFVADYFLRGSKTTVETPVTPETPEVKAEAKV